MHSSFTPASMLHTGNFGFFSLLHLVLNLEEVQNYEYPELVEVLEKMIQRIKVQQTLVNTQGIAQLRLEDEVKPLEIDQQDQV